MESAQDRRAWEAQDVQQPPARLVWAWTEQQVLRAQQLLVESLLLTVWQVW